MTTISDEPVKKRVKITKKVIDLTSVGFEPTPEDWCLKPAP
jgi:hypothetical protein